MASSATQSANPHVWLKVLGGGIWLLLGLSLLANPLATIETVVELLGVFLVALGFYLIAEIFIGSFDVGKGWLAFGGVFSILSGLLTANYAAAMAIVSTSVLAIIVASCVMVLGIVLLMSGLGVLGIIAGIAVVLLGIVLMFNPLATMIGLPLAGGFLSLIAGVAVIVQAFQSRSAHRA